MHSPKLRVKSAVLDWLSIEVKVHVSISGDWRVKSRVFTLKCCLAALGEIQFKVPVCVPRGGCLS